MLFFGHDVQMTCLSIRYRLFGTDGVWFSALALRLNFFKGILKQLNHVKSIFGFENGSGAGGGQHYYE